MEQLKQHAQALTVGGAVLACVLGVPSLAYATPIVVDGSAFVTNLPNVSSANLTFNFDFHDVTNISVPDTLACSTNILVCHVGPPDYSFSVTPSIACADQGDIWSISLVSSAACGVSQTAASPGTASFQPNVDNSMVSTFVTGNFSFTNNEGAAGTLSGTGFFSGNTGPNNGLSSVPEMDAASAANPFAIAIGALLVLSGARRKESPDAT